MTVAEQILAAGYSDAAVKAGLEYADQQGATDDKERFILAVSRILYSDQQLADGARFSVDA